MIHLFDGAMGTMLQQSGLQSGDCPEAYCLDRNEQVTAIHRQYIESGADCIETNTFGANRIKLAHYGLSSAVKQICFAAVRAARAAANPNTIIAGSVGPTGRLLAPLGDLPFEDAYEAFKEQISALAEAGVNYILIETIIDIQEMRAALLAAKAVTKLPVICQLTFENDGRTVTGTDPQTAAVILDSMGADIIGANCSLGPSQLVSAIKAMSAVTTKPLIVQPNAGMPQLEDGKTVFPMASDEFASWIPKLVEAGASFIGGCCGTTPDHIRAARAAIDSLTLLPSSIKLPEKTVVLASRSQRVYIGQHYPTVIIGERINPTGRKIMAAEIRTGNFQSVKREALAQIQAGATVLDVNMGVPGIDQAAAMRQAVEDLSVLTQAPLAIDTTDAVALEAGLRTFPGRALVNSVSAEPERLEAFLPLAKKYGAAVLCLPLAGSGVPTTAQERIDIIREIVIAAKNAGLSESDLLLDALALTVAADSQAALEILRTLVAYRQSFGFPSVMGLSNISYGLPRRDLLNGTFCAMALSAGLDAPILNPYDPLMKDILTASAVLLGKDPHAQKFSNTYGQATPAPISTSQPSSVNTPAVIDILTAIKQCVITGDKDRVQEFVQQALQAGHLPLAITEEGLTAAMNEIGPAFADGRIFLPQVLLSAETMKLAFQTIRQLLPSHQSISRGTVILATVKGDIHDLGKNIVAALLENNGFKIIDLGKDVSPEKIVAAATEYTADIIGLCALMTTTLPQIDIAIRQLENARLQIPVIAGGAVLTQEYAEHAGASYVPDAIAAVSICKELMREKTPG